MSPAATLHSRNTKPADDCGISKPCQSICNYDNDCVQHDMHPVKHFLIILYHGSTTQSIYNTIFYNIYKKRATYLFLRINE